MHDSCAGKAQAMYLAPQQSALPVHMSESMGSGSSQLVDGVPPVPEAQEGAVEQEMPRVSVARPHR